MRRSIFDNHNLENQLTPDDLEEQDKMETFKLSAEVTISLYTEVEAESLEEAKSIAEDRYLMSIVGTGGETKCDTWMADELDGEPKNIEEIRT